GYNAIWHGQKRWNGVAILAKEELEIKEVGRGLEGEPEDEQSRYLEAIINDIVIGCLYLPNGNPAPGPKFDYKLRWFDRLSKRAKQLLDQDLPVIL
ncbi:exodeoxyribonuclease III, partial [Tamlana crocina]|nr:exodeoxyribonuclease III [Tamlana crocina]